MLTTIAKKLKSSDKGQGMVEYGLILALVSVVSVGAVSGAGDKVLSTFGHVSNGISSVEGGEIEGVEKVYTITFKDANGKVLGESEVNHGQRVNVPNIPNVTDDMWDRPLDGIESNGVITLNYSLVETAEDLNNVRNNLNGNYLQVNDIDMSRYGKFDPIGEEGTFFRGIYDGGGYEIKDIHVYRVNNSGLFSGTSGATIKNVGLTNMTLGDWGYSAGITSVARNKSLIENVYVTGNIMNSNGYVSHNSPAGLVSTLDNSTIRNSYANVSMKNGRDGGGLVSRGFNGSRIENSYAVVNFYDAWDGGLGGGLVGLKDTDVTVVNSYYDSQQANVTGYGFGTGLSTSSMKNKNSFNGWDFDSVWEMKPGQYPSLR